MAPSEVWRWSFAQYREIVAALNDANAPDEGSKVPAPHINDFLKFKEEYGERY